MAMCVFAIGYTLYHLMKVYTYRKSITPSFVIILCLRFCGFRFATWGSYWITVFVQDDFLVSY